MDEETYTTRGTSDTYSILIWTIIRVFDGFGNNFKTANVVGNHLSFSNITRDLTVRAALSCVTQRNATWEVRKPMFLLRTLTEPVSKHGWVSWCAGPTLYNTHRTHSNICVHITLRHGVRVSLQQVIPVPKSNQIPAVFRDNGLPLLLLIQEA